MQKAKLIGAGLSACLISILTFVGCSAQESMKASSEPSVKLQDAVGQDDTLMDETEYAPMMNVPRQLQCQSDSDCAMIPKQGCFGCMQGEEMIAVNAQAAKEMMGPRKEMCMAQMKNMQGPPKQAANSHPSCKFNSARCNMGACVPTKLSESALKAKMEEMMKRHGSGQGQQPPQQGSFGGPQQGGFGGQQGGFGGQQGGFGGQQGGFGGQQGGFGGQQGYGQGQYRGY